MLKSSKSAEENKDILSNQNLLRDVNRFNKIIPQSIQSIRENENRIENEISQISLARSTQKLETMLSKLQTIVDKVKPFIKESPIEAACKIVAQCQKEIQEIEATAQDNFGQASFEKCENIETELLSKSKSFFSTLKPLVAAATEKNQSNLNKIALASAAALQEVVNQIGIYSSVENSQKTRQMTQSGLLIISSLERLLNSLKNESDGFNTDDDKRNLQQMASGIAQGSRLANQN